MNHLTHKFLSLNIGWNERQFNEEDFYRLCRRYKAKPIEMPLKVPGFYMLCKGKSYIYTDSRLRGFRRLHVAFHELGHHILHAPIASTRASFFRLKPNSKDEYEAEIFSAVALIPEPSLRRMLAEEIDDEYVGDVLNFRLKVLDLHNI
jgi:Zn-dependent peptidase ImmA (M78 family)